MRPNVLQLFDSFYLGGTERQTAQLTRLLHESGRYRVRVACGRREGPLLAEVERLGTGDIPAFPLTSFYDRNFFTQLRRLARFIRENEIDLVHAHDFYTNIFGTAAAALARVPARIASRRETDGIRSPRQRWVERRAYDLAHAVVANAEAVRGQLIREGVKPGKAVTVYNGLDTSRLEVAPGTTREDALAAVGLPPEPGRRFVTIVANMLHPMKDQETFLRAARRVRERVPDARFVLAGDGPRVETLRATAAGLGLGEDTFFLGRCSRVAELLFASDVCVLSSKGVEGLSNSIIEYMAAGRPVVATDVGGARESVADGETGYVVRPEDDAAIAEHVVGLLTDADKAREMGARGRERATRMFSCEARLARTVELYDGLLARAASAASAARGVEGVRSGNA